MRIIYFDIDTLRPDHLGCYGYSRDTSPNIDQIARDGVIFSHSYTSDSPCVPSRAALISGRFGVHNGVVTHWGPGSTFRFPSYDSGTDHEFSGDSPLFSRYLRQFGMRTISFSSFADRHKTPWFMAGWNEVHTFTLKEGNENADEVYNAVLPWLKHYGAQDNYFLHVHFWDPHRNYTMPPEWADLFRDDDMPLWPDQALIDAQQATDYALCSASELWRDTNVSPVAAMPNHIVTENDLRRLINGYDGAIRYADHHIGLILQVLEQLGVLNDTAIIVSADHGESLGEHGVYANHVDATEAAQRVPLIVRWPQGRHHAVAHRFIYQMDLISTICELLGIPIPVGWEGESFADAISGQNSRTPRDHLIWGHGLYTCQRAVRTDRWLFIRTYHPGLYAWEPETLYDMQNDVHETIFRIFPVVSVPFARQQP